MAFAMSSMFLMTPTCSVITIMIVVPSSNMQI